MSMARRCSYCGHNGHNSRTCPDRGIRLFGVRLSSGGVGGGGIRKSASMSNLPGGGAGSGGGREEQSECGDGYASDGGLVQNCAASRKGVPWSEEEHRLFLLGLHKLGKGDWRGISRKFVTSRTPTQVASHAQKYFIRQSNVSKRKRRSSLFDITQDQEQCLVAALINTPPPPPPPPAPPPPPPPPPQHETSLWLSSSPPPPPPPPSTAPAVPSGDSSELTRLSLGNSSSCAATEAPPPQTPPSPPLAPSRISAFHGIKVSG